jgi:hypothetical protein
MARREEISVVLGPELKAFVERKAVEEDVRLALEHADRWRDTLIVRAHDKGPLTPATQSVSAALFARARSRDFCRRPGFTAIATNSDTLRISRPAALEHDAVQINVGMLAFDRPVAPRLDRAVNLHAVRRGFIGALRLGYRIVRRG